MRLVLDQELPLTVAAVKVGFRPDLWKCPLTRFRIAQTVDKDLGYSLAHLQDLVDAKQALEADESKVSSVKRHLVSVPR